MVESGASAGADAKPRRLPWMPPFAVQVVSASLATLFFILWVRNQWGGARATALFSDVASTAVPLACGWACLARARSSSADLRPAWSLVGAAAMAWAAGQAWWTLVEVRTGSPPATPSLADAGYLLFIPLMAWGTLRFVRHGAGRSDSWRAFLDGAIIGSSFIAIAFVFGLERILLASTQANVALIINLLYPFGDALVLGIVLLRLSRAPRQARAALGLLAVGTILLAVADLWFLVVDSEGLYSTGGILDAFWIMGFQCIALAAVRPGNLSTALAPPQQTPALALVPLYPFTLAAASVCYAEVRDGGRLSDTLFWTAFTVVMLVLARFTIMLLENMRLKAREEAAVAALQGEKALRARMMNAITHDMLNAMSPIRLQMKMLDNGMLGPLSEKQAHAVAMVGRNAEQMARLATDIKDGASIEEGRLAFFPTDMDLAKVVQDAVATRQPEADQRHITLRLDSVESWPMRGDPGRLAQLVDNLLSNALKFTMASGQVTVRVSVDGSEARVAITDTGRGLSEEEQTRLFKPFSQVHDPNEIKEHGTGLGLVICKGIVERHGGHIGVASTGHGNGSTFSFVVPVAPPEQRPPPTHAWSAA